ncbi:MAG: hypothetical protein HC874_14315 [Richelia sp. SL_2_1]|nr:hypothetical protein [Richelia sp. SL_2_1]
MGVTNLKRIIEVDPTKRVIALERERKLYANERDGYYYFFMAAWHTIEKKQLINAPHIKYICRILQSEVERIAKGEKKTVDIIINIPPRASKSSLCTVFLNAWVWTKYPWLKFITISYSSSLSEKHSIKTKRILESKWYQERFGHLFTLSRKKNTNREFHTSEGGMRMATSVRGTITGEGADIIIHDDLLSPLLSDSEPERKRAINFFRDTAYSRLDDPDTGVHILIQQRTHQQDVVGMELEENAEMYQLICLPAQDSFPVTPNWFRKFYFGGLLEPVRLSRKVLERLEKKMTQFAGQYGQQPSKPGGNIIQTKWFFHYELSELYVRARNKRADLIWNFVIDGAYTTKKTNSATVCICFCYFEGRWYIRSIFRDWLGFTELLDALDRFIRNNGYNSQSSIWIEPKANGLDLIDALVRLKGINASRSYSPNQDKIVAANSITPTLKAGRAGIAINSHWVGEYFKELQDFPAGGHTDQVDATVHMIKMGEGGDILASG